MGWNNKDKKFVFLKVVILKWTTHKPVTAMSICPPRFPEMHKISGAEWAVWELCQDEKALLKDWGRKPTDDIQKLKESDIEEAIDNFLFPRESG